MKAGYGIPLFKGTVRAMDLRQIKADPEDFGLMTYDPAFLNTASCQSSIAYIDGDKGILRYRGYPIEQLAETCSFLEVAYLLLNGELPTEAQLKAWVHEVTHHTMIHETTKEFLQGFRHDAHPMGMLRWSIMLRVSFSMEDLLLAVHWMVGGEGVELALPSCCPRTNRTNGTSAAGESKGLKTLAAHTDTRNGTAAGLAR